MDSKDFTKLSRRQAGRIATYINDEAPAMVAQKTLRFIDDNFRAQGWQGESFQKWKDKQSNAGKKRGAQILIVTGRLRRGTNFTTNGRGEVRIYNNTIYADIHNRGGTIQLNAKVKAFTRRKFYTDEVSAPGARKTKFTKTQVGESEVKAHTRKMKIEMPQRQFMPYEGHGSPVLDNAIKRELEKKFKAIFNDMSTIEMDAILAMTFQAIQDRLAAVLKDDNTPQLRIVDQDLGQLEIDETGPENVSVPLPCGLFDLVDIRYTDNSRNSQLAEAVCEVRLGVMAYAGAASYYTNPSHKTNALEYYNIEHRVNKALHGWSDDQYFNPLNRQSATTERRKDNLRVRVLRYSFGFKDNTAMEVRSSFARPDMVIDIADDETAGV